MSRRALATAHPTLLADQGFELGARYDPDCRPHRRMADATKLMAWHGALAYSVQRHHEGRHVARNQHRIDVGTEDLKAVHHVRAGGTNRHRHAIRHDQATGIEGILLGQQVHDYPVALIDARAQIALHKLTRLVKLRGIDYFDPRGRHG